MLSRLDAVSQGRADEPILYGRPRRWGRRQPHKKAAQGRIPDGLKPGQLLSGCGKESSGDGFPQGFAPFLNGGRAGAPLRH